MEDKKQGEDNTTPHTGKTHGPQGIDKAPGEEPSGDNVQYKEETQKGKKVDADLENDNERPGEQSSLED